MATFQAQSGFTTDPETGCVRGYNQYEECRQNYFLKQQNQILEQQQTQGQLQQENAELKSQLQILQQEVELLKTKSVEQATYPQNALLAGTFDGAPAFYIVGIILAVVIVSFFVVKKLLVKS